MVSCFPREAHGSVAPVGRYEDQFIYAVPRVTTPDMREMVLEMIHDAGFSATIADKVIRCESGWNPNAVGDSGQSLGLWQIHQPAHGTGNSAFDPYWATEYAIKLLKKNGWAPWSCYRKLYL